MYVHASALDIADVNLLQFTISTKIVLFETGRFEFFQNFDQNWFAYVQRLISCTMLYISTSFSNISYMDHGCSKNFVGILHWCASSYMCFHRMHIFCMKRSDDISLERFFIWNHCQSLSCRMLKGEYLQENIFFSILNGLTNAFISKLRSKSTQNGDFIR